MAPTFTSSPPQNRLARDHSPTKSSPLRHTISTRSNNSEAADHDDPFITRPSVIREVERSQSTSPVKTKLAAFAKWEQREQDELKTSPTKSSPIRQNTTTSPSKNRMDTSPRKIRDDDWRNAIGRSESRSVLKPVTQNASPIVDRPLTVNGTDSLHKRSESKENIAYRPPSQESLAFRERPSSQDESRSPTKKLTHSRGLSVDTGLRPSSPDPLSSASPPGTASKNSLATFSRSDSMRASTRPRSKGHVRFTSTDTSASMPQLDGEIDQLKKSSTPHLRELSKFAADKESTEELNVHSAEEQVTGLVGRRRLQRSGTVKPSEKKSNFASQFQSTKWMDTQRKHLAAYEYLCHIGEARAWIEDVLDPTKLPPIVQLEEALRDGVTLAEVVVRLAHKLPSDQQRALGSQRILRSAPLSFRHSDNIALFFRFLAEIELPELFRFELIDLYEKKNIPKVIYCIHAVSWLLFRKGVVDFRIGNLVGQLEFADHELEETQKGIDRSGIQMPNFGGMRAAMQVEEEPPPPEPTPEELLAEQEHTLVELQTQMRGALVRLRLGETMQELWAAEEQIAHFQAIARGGFAREIFDFRFAMDNSTRHFQAASKAYLVRKQLHQKKSAWKENKADVVKVQSLWRGRKQRVETKKIKTQLRAQRHGLSELQSAIRGALGRWRAGDLWHEARDEKTEAGVQAFQAAARGAIERMRVGAIMNRLWDVEDTICDLQSHARGRQIRKRAVQQHADTRSAAVEVVKLQAAARGLIQRIQQKTQHGEHKIHEPSIVQVQGVARGLIERLRQAKTQGALHGRESAIVKFQALIRAQAAKSVHLDTRESLSRHSETLDTFQALIRGKAARGLVADTRNALKEHDTQVCSLQSLARAMLHRRSIGENLVALEEEEEQLVALQSMSRAYIERQRIFEQLVEMEKEEQSIIELQSLTRAMLLRSQIGQELAELEEHEDALVELQSHLRGFVVRKRFAEKQKHFRENMQKVIKLQSFVRAKQQGESYKSLVNGKNPPLPVVRRHLHLLTDSNLEFEGELEAERLRRQVVESVRRNELVESYVEGLDVKIALLVKNKITLDEVVKHQKHFGGSASQLLRGSTMTNSSGLDLKALNKNSRKKLTGYEELFFMIQTQPQYLARLFGVLTSRGVSEKEGKNTERLIMTLFGYAQKSREEYMLLKVLATSSQQVISHCQSVEDYMRQQNGTFQQRILVNHIRSPKERAYLKTLFGGMIKNGICAQDHLDLESDPLQIYRAILNNEELSTGMPSQRPRDLPREVVIRQEDVRPRYVEHLEDLRDLGDGFFHNLEETLHRMPFGLRYIAAEQHRALCAQFPREDPGHLAMIVGTWLWKAYLLPALKEPEMWGVVDRGLSPVHKRNLGQVITVLSQVASAGRLFGPENIYLQPLNNWITESLDRWQDCLGHMFDIPSPEEHYDADQFSDLYSKTKPTLYIKLADIFALHSLITDNMAAVVPQRDDPIKELLTDLGSAKGNETDLTGATNGGEITLTLKSRFTVQEDPNAEARALFTNTKRLVLYIIRVQSGSNLMEILLRPITHDDADRWISLVAEELAEKPHRPTTSHKRTASTFDARTASLRGARTQSVYSEAPSSSDQHRDLLDLQSMTYAELKSTALENILQLENPSIAPQFRVSRHNNYQELLNALAGDIRQKHRKRLDRQRDVESTRQTLDQLDEKASFLEDQLRSYNDYIEQCLHTLASKKGTKHKFMLPFTKQWTHERELEKSGRRPQFGSFKYSARQLADKGVLVSWTGVPPEQWGQIDIVISSDVVGVFMLEASCGSLMMQGAQGRLVLDELLQAQYDNAGTVGIFDDGRGGGARLGVNLLLHLVFKKFYRDD